MAKEPTPAPITIPAEEIAAAIVQISEGMKRLGASRLNRKAILLLVSHASGIGQRDVERVIFAVDQLDKVYLKPAVK